MLSVAYGLHAAFMAMRLKASFHASPDAIMALHAKHRQQQRKNPPFGLKNSLEMYDVRCKREPQNLKAAFKPCAETKLVWAIPWRSRLDRRSKRGTLGNIQQKPPKPFLKALALCAIVMNLVVSRPHP